MPINSSNDTSCRYCGAPGPFSARDACYGCIQLISLANSLNDHQQHLNRIIANLDAAESFDQLEYWIGELHVAVSTIETLTKSMAKYTDARGEAR